MFYAIVGEEEYLAKNKLGQLKNEFNQAGLVEKIDGLKIEPGDLRTKITARSLFSGQRFLVIEGLSRNKNQKEITDWLKEIIPPKDEMVVFYETQPDKKTSAYKFLSTLKNFFNCQKLTGADLKKWLLNYLKEKGGSIEMAGLEVLLAHGESDLNFFVNELDKLLAYDKKITLATVRQLTPAGFDANIFNLTDALGQKNKIKAIELITNQLSGGAEPLYLLTMIARQWRNLILIKEAEQKYAGNYQTMAQALKLHPYVVQKTLAQVRQYSFSDLENGYAKILQTDVALKSSNNSPQVLLIDLIAKLV